MINAYKAFWIKAFDFKGRSTRSEYWWAYLANFIIIFLLAIFVGISVAINETLGLFLNLIYILFTLGQFIPSISICIRRVRDMGKGWQWIFIKIIPNLCHYENLMIHSTSMNNKTLTAMGSWQY